MNISIGDLFKEALKLDEHDRATLVGLLIESLEDQPDEDLEALWRLEVERRIKELDEGKVKAIPWEEVKARLVEKVI